MKETNEVGKFLKKFRIEHDIVQKDMCEKLNVYKTYISKVEKGEQKITDKVAKRLMEIYPFTDEEKNEFIKIVYKHDNYRKCLNKSIKFDGWVSVANKIPEEKDYYLTTTIDKKVCINWWNGENFDGVKLAIAWMPLPKPYGCEV